jgi:farnesyl diphosphate synthase
MATAEVVVVANGSGGADTKAAFKETYSKLKEEMLQDPAFEFTDESLQWIDRVMLSSPPPSFAVGVGLN